MLTERDYKILSLVGLCRYVSTEQIAREFFPGPDRARRRLRRLFDAKIISITLVGSTRCNLVSLARAGLAALEGHLPDMAGRARLAGPIRQAGIEHHLAIVDARLYVAATGRAHRTQLVSWSSGSDSAAHALGLPGFKLRPDGVAELDAGGGAFRIAVEVDCATEGAPIIASKLERYEHVFTAGIVHELWMVALGGDRRLAHMDRLIRRHRHHGRTRLLTPEHLKARPALPPPPVLADQAQTRSAPPQREGATP